MTNTLITGAAGFIGNFLTERSLDEGDSVLGLDINLPAAIRGRAAFEQCDIRNAERLDAIINSFKPDRIFHLAAQSYPTVSLAKPRETMEVNASGTINLFEAVRTASIAPVIVVACSSAEYGPVAAHHLPVRETYPPHPLHPYGVSKVAQDLLAAQYFANYAINCVRIRIFNTTGPGKLGDVCSDLTKRTVEIELGLRNHRLPVGNLKSRRAILDVRDLVTALWLSSTRCQPGEVYNVGASVSYSVLEIIEAIRQHTGIDFEIQQDPALVRGCDEPVIAGDISKFQTRTGWTQTTDLRATLAEMLAWWRTQLEATASTSSPARDENTVIV